MLNIVWLGALLVINICSALPQNPSILVQSGSSSPNIISLSVNTKKYVHTISDHFLSITLEPSMIFSALQKNQNFGSNVINMAKGLNPAFVRISGPECNYFRFQGGQETLEPLSVLPVKLGRNNLTITGWHWSQLNEFLDKTGLDLMVGLNVMNRQHGTWDLSNTVDLISYSDKHGYRMAFQLGNDVQAIGSRIDGSSLGRDAIRLRKVLEAFPRYMSSSIISPDIKSCETQEEARYLKNLIIESGPSLSALTYQVPFSSEKNVENPTEIFSYIQNQMESRVWQKDPNNKFLGKIAVKRPLWIVESGNKDRRGDFMDGLIWAQRLCAGARVGINTILRKPSLLSLSEPTSDYWVSVLHKALVGSEVLDVKISSGNKTSLETVAHCTKMLPYDPIEGILAPEYRYNRGAITVFGVNMGSENVKISLKTGEKQSLPLHQYLLTANKQSTKRAERSLSTLLNGQKLFLSPDGELPIVSPRIRGSHQLITIPSQSVFFLILPESRSKACMAVQMEESKESYKNSGRIVDQDEFDNTDYDTSVLDQEDEWTSNEKNSYVAFRPKYTNTNDESLIQHNDKQEGLKYNNNMSLQNNVESHYNNNIHQVEPVVKYVTFSNNNWLSKFPKALNSQEYSVESSTLYQTEIPVTEAQTERSISPLQSRREKYHILAQAVAGKRYLDKNIRSDLYPNLDSTLTSLRSPQKLKLIKRTVDNNDLSSKDLEEIIKQFRNKEKRPKNRSIKSYESSSNIPLIPKEDYTHGFENPEKEITTNNPSTLDIQQSTVTPQTTQQTTITSMPVMSTAEIIKQEHAKVESRIQKIKTRAEQALVKVNERTSQKLTGRRLQEKCKGNEINTLSQQPKTDEKLTISTEIIDTNKEPSTTASISNFTDKIRYNRETIDKTTDSNPKTVRPCLLSKSKNSEIADVENLKTTRTITEPAHSEPSEIDINKTTKQKNSTSKPLKSIKLKGISEKSNVKEGRETTQQPVPKSKIKPVLHPLGKVRTPPNVDIDQVVTNEKVAEIIAENISDGKKTLQSEQIVSPVDKNKESKLEAKTIVATARLKELEEKIKIHRSEMERRLHERTHKVKKRSPTNELIKNDLIDINTILNPANKFESNELDVDVLPVPISETIYRYPRSMADFTLKLNEVNTYVDKNRRAIDPKNNEILEDNDNVSSLKFWKNTNDVRLSAEEDSRANDKNIKSKRKSIYQEIDEDDYSNTTTHMMNKFMNHMQALWRYLKRTLLF